MDYKIIDESDVGRFIIDRYGYVSYESSVMVMHDLLHHPNWRKNMNFLMNFRESNLDAFNQGDLSNLKNLLITLNDMIGSGRCAIVALTNQFAKVSMHKFNADIFFDINIKVFSSYEYEKALAWLEG